MKTRNWKFLMMLSLVAASFTACDDDEDVYYVMNGDRWLSYGNLEKVENGKPSEYAIRIDDGTRLLVSEGVMLNGDEYEEGMRVFSKYAVLDSERDAQGLEGNMNYYVHLYGVADVLTKDPVQTSFIAENEEHRRDSIGNDPINVAAAWFGGKYLNVEFNIPVKEDSDTKHFINLEWDDVTLHNDTVYLTLRHNAYTDKPAEGENIWNEDSRWSWGNVSFDLTSILPEGAASVPVKLLWTAYKKNSTSTEVLSDSGLYSIAPTGVKSVQDGLNAASSSRKDNNASALQVECR